MTTAAPTSSHSSSLSSALSSLTITTTTSTHSSSSTASSTSQPSTHWSDGKIAGVTVSSLFGVAIIIICIIFCIRRIRRRNRRPGGDETQWRRPSDQEHIQLPVVWALSIRYRFSLFLSFAFPFIHSVFIDWC
jgi:hypothetical protein